MKDDKAELVAYVIIAVGLLLLVLTFVMAYLMLTSVVNIMTSQDLSKALGEIFGPITEAVIKIMFLGIMGWVGSIATMRGIQLYKEAKAKPVPSPPPPRLQQPPQQPPPQPQPQTPQQTQPKAEEKKT